jgi:peptidyl-tRNA hydrolase, PTH1 family
MKIIAGLGNPGQKYELTRHNAGFLTLDYFAHKNKLLFKPGKADFYYAKGKIRQTEYMLLKPVTFMNNSGIALREASDLIPGFDLNNLLVVYDDFQLPLGTIRIRTKGGDGGHNGINSIIYHLNTTNFPRMRIGIGRSDVLNKDDFVDFVLSNFLAGEMEKFNEMLPNYSACITDFITQDIKSMMNNYNKNFLKTEEPKEDKSGENEQKP